jgi:hypothetical protein
MAKPVRPTTIYRYPTTSDLTPSPLRRYVLGVGVGFLLIGSLIAIHYYQETLVFNAALPAMPLGEQTGITPFPVSVDPVAKIINDDPSVEQYRDTHVASNHTPHSRDGGWFARAVNTLRGNVWYQNLASPVSRTLVIESGERYEEVEQRFSRIMSWSPAEAETFVTHLQKEVPELPEGKFYPGTYVVGKDASPEQVAIAIADRFNAEVRTRYTSEVEATVPLRDTLIIASLIEREAYDFEDMRHISGIIWNRLFIDMRLQLDATLQYARGTDAVATTKRGWWPVPRPADKSINSPYNTYKHAGLPPGPIANPSIDAIIAALNPRETDCLFYFHADDGTFYCSATYEEHVSGIKTVFGTK